MTGRGSIGLAAALAVLVAGPGAAGCELDGGAARNVAQVASGDRLVLDDGEEAILIGALPPSAALALSSWRGALPFSLGNSASTRAAASVSALTVRGRFELARGIASVVITFSVLLLRSVLFWVGPRKAWVTLSRTFARVSSTQLFPFAPNSKSNLSFYLVKRTFQLPSSPTLQ